MYLSEVFEYLTHGELNQIKLGGADTGAIAVNDYPRVIANVNLGLIALYKRFNLRVRELPLQLYDHITMYNLHSDFAESNTGSAEIYKYIVDGTSIYPFTDNILLITHVYNEIGDELPLNDMASDDSVYTPEPTILQVPEANGENALALLYRAHPDKIALDTTTPETTVVPLPAQYLDALTSFVAWKIFSTINVGDRQEADTYLMKFESACALVEQYGLANTDVPSNTKFEENGWR